MNIGKCGCIALGAVVVLSSCSPVVLYSTIIPEVNAPQGKAIVVIARPAPKTSTAYNADKMSIVFVDGLFGSVTKDNTIAHVPVDSGWHYVMAKIDNTSTVKFNCIPGKVYYLVQKVSSFRSTAPTMPGGGTALAGGLTRVQTTIEAVTQEEFLSLLKTSGPVFRFAQYAPSTPLKNMDPQAKKAHIAAYEFWAKAKPEQARMQSEYQGY
jgi:hypothetical protein